MTSSSDPSRSSSSPPASDNGRSKGTISSSRHPAQFDSGRINRATERVAGGDDAFVDRAIESLQGLQFPAFKFKILEHVRGNSSDPDVIALFEGLDGYIEYKDAYQVRKLVEENGARYKVQNPITDEARINPDFKTRPAPAGGRSTKELEAAAGRRSGQTTPRSLRLPCPTLCATGAASPSRTRTTSSSTKSLKAARLGTSAYREASRPTRPDG